MADKIRVGIVGATVTQGGSGWGANAHVPALKALPDYELKAVCTAHDETAQASKEAFGAELAFHDINDMLAHPDIDLVAVVVRAPDHYDLVMAAERAGKAVFCEWPLGANLTQAEEMAGLARERSLHTLVGLQGRSDPILNYARELVRQGYIGEVLTASLTQVGGNQIERGTGRIWQGDRANGANTMTIAGGHNMDALCFVVGEMTAVSTRLDTMVKEWRNSDTGAPFAVTSPDNIIVAGQLGNGAAVSIHVASVPSGAGGGARLEIYGREGSLAITSRGSLSTGPNTLFGSQGRDPLVEMPVPDRFVLVPEGTPQGSPMNVAQAYVRYADALAGNAGFDPDFEVALQRHRMIDAIERSSEEGRTVQV